MIAKYLHIISLLVLICSIGCLPAQNNKMSGYTISGDSLTFVFEVQDYPNIKNGGYPIEAVYVSGEFNDWSTDKWPMEKINEERYELKKDLTLFTSDFDWEFKFVVNGFHWAEPSSEFKNATPARSITGKPLTVYNLKLYSAFASKYGNVDFKLKGHTDANQVILSGSFNRWDETGFKMQRGTDGWYITLQLRPDVYQYRFIVDGNWMEDPQNPSRVRNEFGEFNSLIDIKKTVEFKLCNFETAETVILTGEFNNWSETDLEMSRTHNCWVLPLELSGGKYHYKFIVDGVWITDPSNSVVEYDNQGHINSVCIVK